MSFIFSIILFTQNSFALSSCQHNLQHRDWPLDCLIELKIHKTPVRSPLYKKLNKWCSIHSREILSKTMPPPFLSIYSPLNCQNLAKRAKDHQEAIKLIEGSFLNSFP